MSLAFVNFWRYHKKIFKVQEFQKYLQVSQLTALFLIHYNAYFESFGCEKLLAHENVSLRFYGMRRRKNNAEYFLSTA